MMIGIKELRVVQLLLWKSWKLGIHHKLQCCLIFLLPMIVPLFYVFLDHPVFFRNSKNDSHVPPIYSKPLNNVRDCGDRLLGDYGLQYSILFTPGNEYTRTVMRTATSILNQQAQHGSMVTTKELNSEKDMVSMIRRSSRDNVLRFNRERVLAAVNFFDSNPKTSSEFRYRLFTDKPHRYFRQKYTPPTTLLRELSWRRDCEEEWYLLLQSVVDYAHFKLLASNNTVNMFFQRFPIPQRSAKYETTYEHMTLAMTLFFTIALVFLAPLLVRRIVEDKANKLTSYLNSCGITPQLYWTSILVDAFLLVAIQILMFAFILSWQKVHVHLDGPFVNHKSIELWLFESFNVSNSLLLVTILFHILQCTLFLGLVSVFFTSPNAAVTATIILWVLTIITPLSLNAINREVLYEAWGLETMSCLLPNSALYWLLRCFKGREELHSVQSDFSNIFEPSRWGEDRAVFHVLFVMFLSFCIYGVLIWYFIQVLPMRGLPAKPWHFPLMELYEKFSKNTSLEGNLPDSTTVVPLSVSNISKSFSSYFNKLPVLRNINFKVESNNITVLLGPNGAGKTTLFNIISGTFPQTEGKVLINGINVKEDVINTQKHLGFCPQHNIVFKYLTVKENLELIREIKCSMRNSDEGFSVEFALRHLGLLELSDKEAHLLSGGHLRCLTLGMALVGPSSVLLLDDPTEAVDVPCKQKIWDTLIECRKEKALLVCSNQFEEVNAIADKVVILVDGNVKCVETLNSLKKISGSGYVLKIRKNPDYLTEDKINEVIQKYIPKSNNNQKDNDEEHIMYQIPPTHTNCLSELLKDLEQNSNRLGIENIGLNVTTVEDAYFKIIESQNNENNEEKLDIEEDVEDLLPNEDHVTLSGEDVAFDMRRHLNQIQCLFLKNFHYSKRSYSLLFTLVLIPTIAIATVLILPGLIYRWFLWSTLNLPISSQKIYGENIKSFVHSNKGEFVRAYMKSAEAAGVSVDDKIAGQNSEDPVQSGLLAFADHDLTTYFFKYLYGASFKEIKAGEYNMTAWYNGVGTHALLISQNLLSNAVLKYLTKNEKYSINMEIRSFEFNEEEAELGYLAPSTLSFSYHQDMFLTGVIFSIASSTFILRPIAERRIGFKHLLHTTSLRPVYYWISNWAFDLSMHAVFSILYTSLYVIYHTETVFGSGTHFFSIFLSTYIVFLFYGWGIIPFAYSLSFTFKRPSFGFVFMSFFTAFIGILSFNIYMGVRGLTLSWYTAVALLFPYPFLMFPSGLASVHLAIKLNLYCPLMLRQPDSTTGTLCHRSYHSCCQAMCVDSDCSQMSDGVSPLLMKMEGVSGVEAIIALFASGIFYFLIVLFREYCSPKQYLISLVKSVWRRLWRSTRSNHGLGTHPDVIEEAKAANQPLEKRTFQDSALIVQNIQKNKRGKRILDGLSFSVRKNECFGILGNNGTGKSLLMKILTCRSKPFAGNAYIDTDVSLTKNVSQYLANIGYCPQGDVLLDRLTGLETLYLFMRLRPGCTIHAVQRIIRKFGLTKMINQPVSTYSGGTRRKLSVAVALLGGQSLLLLDEPTIGVDPATKKRIWNIIQSTMEENNSSGLITSHDLEEAGSLCSRVAVLSSGQFKCISSVWQLKDDYNKGCEIITKIDRYAYNDEERMKNIKNSFKLHFNVTEQNLKYEKFGTLHYHLQGEEHRLSSIFERMENIKQQHGVEDYFISSSSFDHVLRYILED